MRCKGVVLLPAVGGKRDVDDFEWNTGRRDGAGQPAHGLANAHFRMGVADQGNAGSQ